MPSFFQVAQRFDRPRTRKVIAAAANGYARLRGDARRYAVSLRGQWINRQGDVSIVSPEIHTSTLAQIDHVVRDYWCHFYCPAKGDVVVDVGAGIGDDALIFSHLVGSTGRVIAVEAQPSIFACLQDTVARSGLRNVVPVPHAISDVDGEVMISDGNEWLANSIVDSKGDIAVKAWSLDTLADEMKLDRIDLLKMNIEGAERFAVQGMTRIAPQTRHVAISCHDFVADDGGSDAFRTRDFVTQELERLGFHTKSREADTPWLRDVVFGSRNPG
jgi:FkbM family methyltransferase